ARVSQDNRQGRSVGQQLKIGRKRADELDLEIVGEFSDNDVSASQYAVGEREEWPQVETMIRAGQADVLWLWEISRGTRDRIVWVHLVDACQKHRMHIGLDKRLWDTTDPDDMAYLDDQMVRSIHESGKTRKRIMRDIDDHAESGRPHGYTHYAYTREYDPDTGDLVRQVIHPERSKLVKEIARRLVEDKETLTGIAADLNRRGIRTPRGHLMGEEREMKIGRVVRSKGWTHKAITQLMSSTTLMGKRSYNGRVIDEGGWEPVLKPPVWRAVQEALQENRFPRGARATREGAATQLLSGIAVCDVCEARLYATPRADRSGSVYRCNGLGEGAPVHGTRLVSTLDAAVETFLFERLQHPDVRAALVPHTDEGELSEAQARVPELETELDELYADVEAGRVSRRMAQSDESRLLRELEEARVRARPVVTDPLLEELVSGSPRAVWEQWTLVQRRAALKLLTEQ